jgi:hypothetical protein
MCAPHVLHLAVVAAQPAAPGRLWAPSKPCACRSGAEAASKGIESLQDGRLPSVVFGQALCMSPVVLEIWLICFSDLADSDFTARMLFSIFDTVCLHTQPKSGFVCMVRCTHAAASSKW